MHIGNLKFRQNSREEQLEVDGTESKAYFTEMQLMILFRPLLPGLPLVCMHLMSCFCFSFLREYGK